MGPNINTGSWDSQPCLTADGKTLYFSSDRKGSTAKSKDIWTVSKGQDGKWLLPVLLDSMINTSGAEESPFIHADGQTLFFRSTGHLGMGSFDLFMSRKNKDGSWQKPVNLGYPINTAGNEGSIFIDRDGKTVYYASDRTSIADPMVKRDLDIYTFELPTAFRPNRVTFVSGSIKNRVGGEAIVANYVIKNLTTNEIVVNQRSDDKGHFLLPLNEDNQYALVINEPGYELFSVNFFPTSSASVLDPYFVNAKLDKVQGSSLPEENLILNNVFFAFGSYDIDPKSDFELQIIANYLKENVGLKAKIIGHTDDIGNEENNRLLSEKRAEAVVKKLVSFGVDSLKLNFEGKGESQPIVPNDSDANRQLNRRTEMQLL